MPRVRSVCSILFWQTNDLEKTIRRTMTMRMRWMAMMILAGVLMWSRGVVAAEISGKWVAEISGPMLLEPVYARVSLETAGDTVSGMWGSNTVKGSVKGSQVTL